SRACQLVVSNAECAFPPAVQPIPADVSLYSIVGKSSLCAALCKPEQAIQLIEVYVGFLNCKRSRRHSDTAHAPLRQPPDRRKPHGSSPTPARTPECGSGTGCSSRAGV